MLLHAVLAKYPNGMVARLSVWELVRCLFIERREGYHVVGYIGQNQIVVHMFIALMDTW
jgi:hypothetical protein